MNVILQEKDMQIVNDGLQEISELARDVVKGGKDEIQAAFSISIKARNLQRYLAERGVLHQEAAYEQG